MLSTHPLAAARQRVAEIDSAELRRRVAAGARLIDVREPHEFSQGHLHGAINLPLSRLPLLLAEDPSLADLLSRDSDLVIYCRSGGRSAVRNDLGIQQLVDPRDRHRDRSLLWEISKTNCGSVGCKSTPFRRNQQEFSF